MAEAVHTESISQSDSQLHLKKLSTGHLWFPHNIRRVQPELSPISRWVQEFYDEFGFLSYPQSEVQVFREFLAEYIQQVDPQLKGLVSLEEVTQVCGDHTAKLPIWNEDRQLDFFKVVQFVYSHIQDKSAFRSSKLFSELPKNCNETKPGVQEALERIESLSIWERLLSTE